MHGIVEERVLGGVYRFTWESDVFRVTRISSRKWLVQFNACADKEYLPTLQAAKEYITDWVESILDAREARRLQPVAQKPGSVFLAWSVYAFQMAAINYGIANAIYQIRPSEAFEGWGSVGNLSYFSTCQGSFYDTYLTYPSLLTKTVILLPGWSGWQTAYANADYALHKAEKQLRTEVQPDPAIQTESKSVSTEITSLNNSLLGGIEQAEEKNTAELSGYASYPKVSALSEAIEHTYNILSLKETCIVSSVARWSLLCHYLNCFYLAVNRAIKDLHNKKWFPFSGWDDLMANFYTHSKVSYKYCGAVNRPYHWIPGIIDTPWRNQIVRDVDCLIQSWDAIYKAAPEIAEKEWGCN